MEAPCPPYLNDPKVGRGLRRETELLNKTHRESPPVGSLVAFSLLTVLVNRSVFCAEPSDITVGAEMH